MNHLKKAAMITNLYEKVVKNEHTVEDVTNVLNAWQSDNEKLIEKGYFEKYWEYPTSEDEDKYALEYFSENVLSNPKVIQNLYEDLKKVSSLDLSDIKQEAGGRDFTQ